MPKRARGSRGISKGRPNPVMLSIGVLRAPRALTKTQFRAILIGSIHNGSYRLPAGLIVQINWSNDRGKTWKSDEWTNAMIDSTQNGRGWDSLVLRKLERERV